MGLSPNVHATVPTDPRDAEGGDGTVVALAIEPLSISRRTFLGAGIGVVGVTTAGLALAACAAGDEDSPGAAESADVVASTDGSSLDGGGSGSSWGQSFESYDAAIASAVDATPQPAARNFESLQVLSFRGGFDGNRLQYQTVVRIAYS